MGAKRSKEIKLRLTESEHDRLQQLAGRMQLARWLRETALGTVSEKEAEKLDRARINLHRDRREKLNRLTVDPELLRALRGIGNNINQLARHCNTAAKGGNALDMAAVALELQAISATLQGIRADHQKADSDDC